MNEQEALATAQYDYQAALAHAQADDKARKKYHLRLIRHAGWCYEPGSKAHWITTGAGTIVLGQGPFMRISVIGDREKNRRTRRAEASRARRAL
jgi:hypothetical protein